MPEQMTALPLKLVKRMERVLLNMEEELINEEEAAKLLGIKKSTLLKKVSNKEIPPSFYKVSPVNGNRFYDKNKLTGKTAK